MKERTRILLMALLMAVVALGGVSVALAMQYQTALEMQKARLQEIVASRALTIESVVDYDLRQLRRDHPGADVEQRAFAATLSQIHAAHESFAGFGETGEFTMAQRSGDQIAFVLRHRHDVDNTPAPVPLSSHLAEPMRRALLGETGILVGLDYRGETVVAAHRPVRTHGLGLVAKIDLAEIQRPFVRAGLMAMGFVLISLVAGTLAFVKIGNPMVVKLEEQAVRLQRENEERRANQEALRELGRSLEQRVGERTEELESANRQLEEFAYSVSHDLRAPLRAVHGFADIIVERHRHALNEEGRHYVDNIVQASAKMSRLIEDLLRYARLGRRGVSLEPLALGSAVNNVLDTLAESIEEAGAEVHLAEDLPVVQADPSLLAQVLTNLIGNAVKYRQSDRRPTIRVDWEEQDGVAVLRVADNGIGIDERFHGKVFGVFQRLHTDEAYPGTGIGLAVAAKAAALMDGRIWLESQPGEGSVFSVALTLADKHHGRDGLL